MSQQDELQQMIKSIRSLCCNIAKLLRTADSIADEYDLKLLTGSGVTRDNSDSLDQPEYWFPNTFYRYYQRKGIEDEVVCIAVILDHRKYDELWKGIRDWPLLTLGHFKYETKERADGFWDLKWMPRVHLFLEESDETGKVTKRKWREVFEKDTQYGLDSVMTMGVPLGSINDESSLRDRIGDFMKEIPYSKTK